MADDYLENKFEALQLRREKEKKARQAAWKKRMDAYRKRLQEQAMSGCSKEEPVCEDAAKSQEDNV